MIVSSIIVFVICMTMLIIGCKRAIKDINNYNARHKKGAAPKPVDQQVY